MELEGAVQRDGRFPECQFPSRNLGSMVYVLNL
jgi:hypothetical protein